MEDLGNYRLVATSANKILFMNPPSPMESMTKYEALVFAVWIVALAEDDEGDFLNILDEVLSI